MRILCTCLGLWLVVTGLAQPTWPLLDPDFAGSGYRLEGTEAVPTAIVQDKLTGIIYVAGNRPATGEPIVRSYLEDGTSNTLFGQQGEVVVEAGGPMVASAMAIQYAGPHPRLFVSGTEGGGIWNNVAVACLRLNGNPDSSFNGADSLSGDYGWVRVPVTGASKVRQILPLPDGKLYLGGESTISQVVVRLNPSGAFDPTFANGGTLRHSIGLVQDEGGAIAVDQLDNLYLAGMGRIGTDVMGQVACFLPNGLPKLDFGTNGELLIDPAPGEISQQIFCAYDESAFDFRVMASWDQSQLAQGVLLSRFNTQGQVQNGPVIFGFGANKRLGGMQILPDGKLQVAGAAHFAGQEDFFLHQWTDNLARDDDFGDEGLVKAGLPQVLPGYSLGAQVSAAFQADGKVLLCTTVDDGSGPQWALFRLDPKAVLPPDPVADSVRVFSLNKASLRSRMAVTTDLDGDGDEDLLVQDKNRLWAVETVSDPDGSGRILFHPEWRLLLERNTTDLLAIDLADTDGDGEEEWLLAYPGAIEVLEPVQVDFESASPPPAPTTQGIIAILIALAQMDLAPGDFNGDGLDDFAVVASQHDTAAVYLSQGNGQFSRRILYTGTGGQFLETGDIDDDGDLDLIVGGGAWNLGGSNVWINDGQANFTSVYSMWPPASSVQLIDLDQNGSQELLWYELYGPTPDLWYSSVSTQNQLTFSAPQILVPNVGHGFYVEIDGLTDKMFGIHTNPISRSLSLTVDPDLGQPNPADSVAYYRGATLSFFSGPEPGKADHFMGAWTGNLVEQNLFFNAPDPNAIDVWERALVFAPHDLTDLLMQDFDGDGDLDILALDPGFPLDDRTGSRLLGYENINGDLYEPFSPAVPVNGLWAMAPLDFNGDGKLDLLASSAYDGGLYFMEQENLYRWHTQIVLQNTPISSYFKSITLGDRNGNGKTDAVLASPDDNTLYELMDVTGPTPALNALSHPLQGISRVALGDINNDGLDEIIALGSNGICQCTDGFSGCSLMAGQLPLAQPTGLDVADLNGDGWLDLVVSYRDGIGSSALQASIVAYENLQGQGFQGHVLLAMEDLSGVGVRDFNDVVVQAHPDGGHLIYYSSHAPGLEPKAGIVFFPITDWSASEPVEWPVGESGYPLLHIGVGDLNGDGLADLAAIQPGSGNVWAALVGVLPAQDSGTTALAPPLPETMALLAYPNPSRERVTLSSPEAWMTGWTLYDLQGRVCQVEALAQPQAAATLSWGDLPAGPYLLAVKGRAGQQVWLRLLRE